MECYNKNDTALAVLACEISRLAYRAINGPHLLDRAVLAVLAFL